MWLGLAPNERKANKVLRRLKRKRRIKDRGYVTANSRLKKLWAGFPVRLRAQQHEWEISVVVLRMRLDECYRGSQVRECYELDAELLVDGKEYGLELDRHTEGYAQVARRMAKLAPYPNDVLWLVKTPARRERFLELANGRETFWCGLWSEVLADPHGEVWVNAAGETASLPRSTKQKKGVGPDGPTHE